MRKILILVVGALGDSKSYRLRKRVSGDYLIYSGPHYNLAIPFVDKKPVYISYGMPGPESSSNGWEVLCQ
mgnify:FL=1